jgi:S-adenosylmethionine uptake transporter
MVCAFYAFSVLPLAEVYSLLFAFPLFVTVLSIPILGEVVRFQRWAAVGVGLIGVLIVLRPGATDITLGHMAALTAAFCSALGSVLVRKIGNEERSAVLILYPMLLAIVVMSLMQPAVYQPPSLLHLAMMALVGVFSVIAQHLIILAYRAAPAGVVAPSQYSQIIWATLFGMIFFGEHPDGWVAVGASVIIASGIFVVWRESRSNTTSANTPVLRVRSPRSDTGASRPGE